MTIEVPTPSADLLSQIETATLESQASGTAAIAAIRERFAQYAKHNGFITISYELTCYASSNGEGTEIWEYLREAGRKVRGLLCYDTFTTERPHSQNAGIYTGERLWLTPQGWVRIVRSGNWSNWQNSDRAWEGRVDTLTDEAVSSAYSLDAVLKQLGETMAEMCGKLPERHSKLKARAELAQRTIEALKA